SRINLRVPVNRRFLKSPWRQRQNPIINHLISAECSQAVTIHAYRPELSFGSEWLVQHKILRACLSGIQMWNGGFYVVDRMRIFRIDVWYLLYDEICHARRCRTYGLDGDADVGSGLWRYLQDERIGRRAPNVGMLRRGALRRLRHRNGLPGLRILRRT